MKRITLVVLALAVAVHGLAAQDLERLFKAGVDSETVDRNCKAAIEQYKKVAAGNNRALAAQALLRMAGCYKQLGDPEWRKIDQELISKYPDQKSVVEQARARLGGSAEPNRIVKRLVCVDCANFRDELGSDGRSILGSGPDGDLAVWDLSDSSRIVHKRLMVEAGSGVFDGAERPLLSPDGRRIVYVRINPSSGPSVAGDLRLVANEIGAKPRVLAGAPEFLYFRTGAWSRDGKSVLVLAQRPDETWQIAWVSVANGLVTPVVSLGWRILAGRGPVLSPDGRYIAYAALAGNPPSNQAARGFGAAEEFGVHIYVVASDGSTGSEPVKTAGVNDNPAWSPDGKHLLFTSNLSGRLDLWAAAMRDGEATNSPVLVRANIGDRVNLLGVRSGSYYYTDRVETEYVYFADLNPRGSAPKKGFVGSNPAWSPDGKLVAFKRFRDRVRNEVDVVVHSLESGQEKVYSSKIGFSSASGPVVWTHDGTGLVVDVHKFGADLRSPGMLYRVDLKSGAYREIPNAEVPGPAFTYPWLTWALSPDDKTVYFSRRATGDDPAGVFAADLAGGPARFVRPPVDRGFKLSPDGRTFLRSKDSFSFEQVAVDGTDSREFRVNPLLNGGPVWTPDGRGILFGVWTPRDATAPLTESGKTRIMRVPAGGGDQAFTGVELRGGVGGLILSPDGSRLAFSTRESATELWALDNVASALR